MEESGTTGVYSSPPNVMDIHGDQVQAVVGSESSVETDQQLLLSLDHPVTAPVPESLFPQTVPSGHQTDLFYSSMTINSNTISDPFDLTTTTTGSGFGVGGGESSLVPIQEHRSNSIVLIDQSVDLLSGGDTSVGADLLTGGPSQAFVPFPSDSKPLEPHSLPVQQPMVTSSLPAAYDPTPMFIPASTTSSNSNVSTASSQNINLMSSSVDYTDTLANPTIPLFGANFNNSKPAPPTANVFSETNPSSFQPLVPLSTNSSSSSLNTISRASIAARTSLTDLSLDPKILNLPTKKWIEPNIFYDIPFTDPVQDVISKSFVLSERPARKVPKFDESIASMEDSAALQKLLSMGSFRAAAQFAKSRLVNRSPDKMHPGKVDEICRLWFIRLLCLSKLKCWEVAVSEAEKIGVYLEKNIDPAVSVPDHSLTKAANNPTKSSVLKSAPMAPSKPVEASTTEASSASWNFESYPDLFPGRFGSMVSFELRNLHALWPSYKGNYTETINRLYTLSYSCRQSAILAKKRDDENSNTDGHQLDASYFSTDFWKKDSFLLWRLREFRLQIQIASCLMELNDYVLSSQLLKKALLAIDSLKSVPSPEMNDSQLGVLISYFKADLLSSIGRCFLQLGDIHRSKKIFGSVETLLIGFIPPENTQQPSGVPRSRSFSRSGSFQDLANPQPSGGSIPTAVTTTADPARQYFNPITSVPSQLISHPLLLLNRGLQHLSAGDYESSSIYFTTLLTQNPTPIAVNNLATSYLYTGNVGQAISFLESICIEKPSTAGVCESLVFNLCTCYDLVENSLDKKKRVLASTSKCAGDAFNAECLKIV